MSHKKNNPAGIVVSHAVLERLCTTKGRIEAAHPQGRTDADTPPPAPKILIVPLRPVKMA